MSSRASVPPLDLLIALATFGLILFLFYPPLKEIALVCWNDEDYSHGLLLPLVAAYMYWENRDYFRKKFAAAAAARLADRSLFIPELLLLAGLFGFFLGQASGISFTSWVAFFPTVAAALWLLFGHSVALAVLPPILLLFMAKPLPDSVVVRVFWPLQVFAAKVSKLTLELFDVPVHLSGNIIEIPAMRLLVEEACSGMRSVMALVTLAAIVIYFVELRPAFRAALVAAPGGCRSGAQYQPRRNDRAACALLRPFDRYRFFSYVLRIDRFYHRAPDPVLSGATAAEAR